MRAHEFIVETELDPKGWGETPMGTDIDYFGLQVKMRPSTFLKLSHPLGASEQNPDVEKHMQAGGKIAYPFLEIKDPVEWEDGDFSQVAKVVNHEGRNRMTHWIKLKGDEPIQVNLFLRGANRRRYITNGMIQALSQGLISQTGQLVSDPFEANTALEEGWKEKLATAALGGALTLGGMGLKHYMDQPTQQVQPAQHATQQPSKQEFLKSMAQKVGMEGQELMQFLAQAAHETANFTKMAEVGTSNYFAKKYDPKYNPRKAKILGNTQVGDGEAFKGRGFLHLTGRDNYARASKALYGDDRLVRNPDLVEKNPKVAAETAIWYWQNRVAPKVSDFSNVKQVTKKINPGMKGVKSRAAQYQQQVSAMQGQPSKSKKT